jgi:hypothetical protein
VTPRFRISALREAKPWEYFARFVFGGIIASAAGLLGHACGHVVGGLFLAFPAILPASLTLVKRHDGRRKAFEDARGGRLGSIGLMAFAVVVWAAASAWSPRIVLTLATCVWLIVDVSLWLVIYGKAAA